MMFLLVVVVLAALAKQGKALWTVRGHARWVRFLSYTEAQEERREVPLASFVVASKILYGKAGSFER